MTDSLTNQGKDSSMLTDAQKMELRDKIIKEAAMLMHIPYRLGAEWTDYTRLPAELDCSELVEGVYKIVGLNMPDGSQNQFDFTVPAPNPKIGDLAFFGRGAKPTQIYHVGVIFGDDMMIEARGYQPGSSFETGKVILRPRLRWEQFPDFCGYRSHSKLA